MQVFCHRLGGVCHVRKIGSAETIEWSWNADDHGIAVRKIIEAADGAEESLMNQLFRPLGWDMRDIASPRRSVPQSCSRRYRTRRLETRPRRNSMPAAALRNQAQ